ncbi:MAG: coiled-coil domain-containing protein [Planctomycetota bacterium]
MNKAVLLAGCVLILAAGCENNSIGPTDEDQISALRQEKAELTRRLEQAETETDQLEKRIQVLSGLPRQGRPENIYSLKSIRITRYTNFYDKDKDGKKEKLIVYIKPIDDHGDIIKAAGAVDVQLWDLNKESGEALLGKWNVKPEELKKLWFATLLTINYRLTFDIADKVDKFDKPLTVKVVFTDYLSGRVFEEQKVIKPQ